VTANRTTVIVKKEFASYFSSPTGYVFLTAFLVLSAWLYFRVFFLVGQASLRQFFTIMPWLFLFFVPAVTMRMWAEERKLGTDEILLTLPIPDREVVIGKFLAGFGFLALAIALTFPLPMVVSALGNPDPGPIVGGYLGLLLMGAAYISIGLFASSLTENQIVAFIVGITISFVLFILGEDIVVIAVPRWLAPVLRYMGLGQHFASIARGVIDTRDLIYYFSVVGFFLYLNVRTVESRKWR
jgi:ABC-2 type transport system permease protein